MQMPDAKLLPIRRAIPADFEAIYAIWLAGIAAFKEFGPNVPSRMVEYLLVKAQQLTTSTSQA